MFQAAILLDYRGGVVDAELQLPPSRLGEALHTPPQESTLAVLQPVLLRYAVSHLEVFTTEGVPWQVEGGGLARWKIVDGAPYVTVPLVLRPPRGGTLQKFVLRNHVLTAELPRQVVLVSVRSDWNSSTFASDPQMLGVLNGIDDEVVVERAGGSWTHGFRSVFQLGVRHIAEGTDHLLFLLALLLPAPLLAGTTRWKGFAGVRHSFAQILKVVTAFTVGHSLTLALATAGVMHVPERPIEVLIAVSILVSAIHAIRPLFPGREALVAGAFGLIHGLAFASTIAELGLRGWERCASIAAFNLGIESMQLLVVLCVMPSLMLLSQTRLYPGFRVTGATLAGVAAGGWILQRATGVRLPVDAMVDELARHALHLGLALFAFAVAAFVLARPRGQKGDHVHPGTP